MLKRLKQQVLALSYCLLFSFVISPQALAEPLTFVAIGDMPYSDEEIAAFNGPIKDKIQTMDTPFVVHYGDIKAGKDSCTLELLNQRRDEIYSLLPRKVIFTPGDNEWTDCDRKNLDTPVSELDMQQEVRKAFFDNPLSLPNELGFTQQDSMPENSRWIHNNSLFMTLHHVGTHNGRAEILLDNPQDAFDLIEQREINNQRWLSEAFDIAAKKGLQSLVITHHADVTQVKKKGRACTPDKPVKCDAFLPFKTQVAELASAYPELAVLIIHGDTGPFCMAKDMGADNIWRLNAWGDYKEPADAVEIEFDAKRKDAPFKAQTLLHRIQPDDGC